MAVCKTDDFLSVRIYKGTGVLVGSEIEDLPKFKVRDDDVWVCSFLRSGTTLTQEMTYLVMTLNFKTAKTVILDDRFPFIDTKDLNYPYFRGLEYLANLPSDEPRFIKTHCHYFLLPDDITQRKKRKVYGFPWCKHVKEFWEHRDDGHVLFLQFENVIQDRRGTVHKIADFLGKSLTEEDIDNIVEHTSLENMKRNETVNLAYMEKLRETDKTEGAFINKGLSDGWKTEVPEDIQKRVDDMIRQELKDTDLHFE